MEITSGAYRNQLPKRRYHSGRYKKNRGSSGREKSTAMRSSFYLLILWAAGALVGVLFASALGEESRESLNSFIQIGAQNMASGQVQGFSYFLNRIWSYGKYMVVLWACGFIPYGWIGVLLLIAGRGFFYGFAQAVLILGYGAKGIGMGLMGYFPHNLLLLPMILFVGQLVMQAVWKGKSRYYFIVLGIGLLAAVCAAAIEAYLTPVLLQWMMKGWT